MLQKSLTKFSWHHLVYKLTYTTCNPFCDAGQANFSCVGVAKQHAVGLTLSDKIDDHIATIEQALQCLILRWDGQENPWQVLILPLIE